MLMLKKKLFLKLIFFKTIFFTYFIMLRPIIKNQSIWYKLHRLKKKPKMKVETFFVTMDVAYSHFDSMLDGTQ
jgi:hypothetical protein